MESLIFVISEIVICLIVAWVLGFLFALFLFKNIKKELEETISELEDNITYSRASNKNQEREIIQQTLKIQEYERVLNGDKGL
jgi:phosphate/sulfate permease